MKTSIQQIGLFQVLLAFVLRGNSYPTGPPVTADACVSMQPTGHGVDGFTGLSPYSVVPSVDEYTPGENITVRIEGRYLGFLIQARKEGTTEAVGSFSNHPSGTKRLGCPNGDSASHSDRTTKNNIELTWTPPSEKGEGPVRFV
ncbi:putative ferric-chelate reductase 1 [Branchiostoma lanceolatum]|uniref:putative ferric-chelate reductase 1 n=1 Tax=Branchiostoma lanceolatum TaxID=7740 RepID=UPI0034531A28